MYLLTVTCISKGLSGVITASRMASTREIKNFFLYGDTNLNTRFKRPKSNSFFFGVNAK